MNNTANKQTGESFSNGLMFHRPLIDSTLEYRRSPPIEFSAVAAYGLKYNYHNTKVDLIRTNFDQTVSITPMKTVEIVIGEIDNEGGTGANFVFDWAVVAGSNNPLFEAVMISTSGQQRISFTSHGVRIN